MPDSTAATTTREYKIAQVSCPSCHAKGLDLGEVEYQVENFGRVLMSVTSCSSCGFRHSDVFSLTAHDPTVMRLKIDSPDQLKTRIVRSGTSMVTVPELGVSIKPGMNSEGFISNVEGVLTRIEDVLQFMTRSLGQKNRKAESMLRKVQRARKGNFPVTIVLKDPFGNSGIISEKVKRRRMSARELNRLKFGEHAIAQRKKS